MKIAFIVWTVVSLIYVGIAIYTAKQKTAAGFFSNSQAPTDIKDVAAYNKAVARIWLFFAAGMEIVGLPLLFAEQNDPKVFISIIGTIALINAIVVMYMKTYKKYRK